jgi:hypothetical protein
MRPSKWGRNNGEFTGKSAGRKLEKNGNFFGVLKWVVKWVLKWVAQMDMGRHRPRCVMQTKPGFSKAGHVGWLEIRYLEFRCKEHSGIFRS